MYFMQERLLFHPETLEPDYQFSFTQEFKEVNLKVNEDKNISIVQFLVPDSISKGVVLYYHGNMANISRYADQATAFTRNGYEVWMIDYPGFGKSTGERSESIMHDDALKLFKMASAKYSSDSIIVYGRSIGTGLATRIASHNRVKKVILETPYYDIRSLAKRLFPIYPVSWLLRYEFPNNIYLKELSMPVTIFHGTDDLTIPYSHSEKLVKENPSIELITIEGGSHNDLSTHEQYKMKLDSILKH